MILLLSPAKRLDYESPLPKVSVTQPRLLDESERLIRRLRELSPAEIASLMSLSDPLAALNHARYAEWHRPFDTTNARPAVLAFAGDVYEGLDAAHLPPAALKWLQSHVRILSGLYGLLRPLDLMQPYRLEMGTRFGNERGRDLYAFWGDRITRALNKLLKGDPEPVLVNLASEEYFGAVDPKALKARLVTCVFEDWQPAAGRYRIVSFHAKRARGMMARHAIRRRAAGVDDLKTFNDGGYRFDAKASETDRWVFRRKT